MQFLYLKRVLQREIKKKQKKKTKVILKYIFFWPDLKRNAGKKMLILLLMLLLSWPVISFAMISSSIWQKANTKKKMAFKIFLIFSFFFLYPVNKNGNKRKKIVTFCLDLSFGCSKSQWREQTFH